MGFNSGFKGLMFEHADVCVEVRVAAFFLVQILWWISRGIDSQSHWWMEEGELPNPA